MAKEYFGEHSLRSLVQLIKAEFDKVRVETKDALSFKVDSDQLATNIAQAIAGTLSVTDIVNSLTSEDIDKVLSAAQGKVLKDLIDTKGVGDMLKSTYDADEDGIIDHAQTADTATNATNAVNAETALTATSATTAENATKLGGIDASDYAQTSAVTEAITSAKSEAITGAVNEVGTKINKANGIAGLDSNGLIPAEHLPSYVDDVVDSYYYEGAMYSEVTHDEETGDITAADEANKIEPATSKIYIDLDTNTQYRWSGTVYVPITSSDLTEMTSDDVQSIWESIADSAVGIGAADVVSLRISDDTGDLNEDGLSSDMTN